MKIRSVLPLLLLLAVSFSLGWYLFRRREPTTEEIGQTVALLERRGDHWRAVDTRSGVMGTRFSVELAADSPEIAQRACSAAYTVIESLESRLSTWRSDSLLSRVNRDAHGSPVVVDEETFRVIRLAERLHALSGGAFDPTVGPLVELWRTSGKAGRIPSDSDIERALSCVGMSHVSLDPRHLEVSFSREGLALDLGGIAKGYAAQAAARSALDEGALACRVNAGGDHVALGSPPWEPAGFRVAVRDPLGAETDTLEDVTFFLSPGLAVATSGNYERYTEIAGRKFGHILDPKTGRPVENPVVQVTVLTRDGHRADALATALAVLGEQHGLALTEKLSGVEALFIVRRGDRLARIASSAFPGAWK